MRVPINRRSLTLRRDFGRCHARDVSQHPPSWRHAAEVCDRRGARSPGCGVRASRHDRRDGVRSRMAPHLAVHGCWPANRACCRYRMDALHAVLDPCDAASPGQRSRCSERGTGSVRAPSAVASAARRSLDAQHHSPYRGTGNRHVEACRLAGVRRAARCCPPRPTDGPVRLLSRPIFSSWPRLILKRQQQLIATTPMQTTAVPLQTAITGTTAPIAALGFRTEAASTGAQRATSLCPAVTST